MYLCQQESWISDIQIAMELETSIPVTRKLLKELGDVVEKDGDGNWQIVKTTAVEIEIEKNDKLTIKEEKIGDVAVFDDRNILKINNGRSHCCYFFSLF